MLFLKDPDSVLPGLTTFPGNICLFQTETRNGNHFHHPTILPRQLVVHFHSFYDAFELIYLYIELIQSKSILNQKQNHIKPSRGTRKKRKSENLIHLWLRAKNRHCEHLNRSQMRNANGCEAVVIAVVK